MTPEFSVIIPARRGGIYLRAAVESVLRNPVDLEVLIVHDRRPGEPPLAPVTADARVRVVESPGPGQAIVRNTGMDGARGRYLAFLDDDDLWLPTHLTETREMFERYPGAVLVAKQALRFFDPTADGSAPAPAETTGLEPFWPDRGEGPFTVPDLLLRNRLSASHVVLDARRLTPADRFPGRHLGTEDWGFWLELARTRVVAFDPRPGGFVRRRRGSMSNDWRKMAQSSLGVLQDFLAGGTPAGTVTEAAVRARLGGLWHDLAYACLVEDDVTAARPAVRRALAHRPLRVKTWAYAAASLLPGPVRRGLFARGRRARESVIAAGGGSAG